MDPEAVQDPDQPQHNFRTEDSLHTLTQDIRILSNQLTSKIGQSSAPSPAVLEAVQSAKYTLTAAIASSQGTSALPHKNFIVPNQKSWMETAKWMGVKKAPKCQCLPEEHGLTERSIGVAKTKKRRRVHNDPYAGANVSACACASTSTVAPALVHMPASQSIKVDAHARTLNARAHARAPISIAAPSLMHVPASQPVTASAHACACAPIPAVPPALMRAPASQPVLGNAGLASTTAPALVHAPASQLVIASARAPARAPIMAPTFTHVQTSQ
ncbi:hypothetical protein BJV78DRAFT_1286809 [Lactifluus subvellereus]|nr:hypothetical protein BJV78DRAFT_1286809 [Lactifluus subvellereus]